jgi:hypothetical protein
MTDKQRMDLQVIADKILSLKKKLDLSIQYRQVYDAKYNDFVDVFHENKGESLVKGLLCLVVLIFDFIVSQQTLFYLAIILRIDVVFIAIIFSILDGGIAILASGGLAGTNPYSRRKMQKTWRPILVLLAVVKIVLFVVYLKYSYSSNIIDVDGGVSSQWGGSEMLRILIPQIFFVAIIYFVLGVAGFGLWYIVGIAYYGIWEFLLTDPVVVENKLIEKCKEFKATAENFGSDADQAAQQFHIEDIMIKYLGIIKK